MNVAMLLSCDAFEFFFENILKFDRERYLASYRNDFAWYYAKGLLENGVQPIIYIPSGKSSGRYETDVGIPVRFLPLPFWYVPLHQLWRGMRATRWSFYLQERINAALFLGPLRQALHNDGVDLLYVQEYWGGRFDHLVTRVDLPVAVADHGGTSRGVLKWFKRRALSRAAVIYTQTQQESREVGRYGAETLNQPNGVDTAFFRPLETVERQATTILTIARLMNNQKRTLDLIEAMRLLPKDWTLDIVGTGPDREMLESKATEFGLAERVTFHGFKGREDVRSMLQRCGVYAMPSAHEAICLAVLEAMSCGAPVVVSRIKAFEAIVEDGVDGLLYPVGDVPALAQAIQQASRDQTTLGSNAAAKASAEFDAATLYRRLAESLRDAATRWGKPV